MSDIKLSPKYGVNPTIPVCFWCGQPKNEIALLGRIGDGRKGEDFEAPKNMVLDYEPCDKCRDEMGEGFTCIEVNTFPNQEGQLPMQEGIYPTGRWLVIKKESAKSVFPPEYTTKDKLFLDEEVYNQLFKDAIM